MGINLLRQSLLYFHAKGTVLEVGTGTGRNLSYYPSHVKRLVLSETSNQMLWQARRNCPACQKKNNLDLHVLKRMQQISPNFLTDALIQLSISLVCVAMMILFKYYKKWPEYASPMARYYCSSTGNPKLGMVP
jgi:hypothetical protein